MVERKGCVLRGLELNIPLFVRVENGIGKGDELKLNITTYVYTKITTTRPYSEW